MMIQYPPQLLASARRAGIKLDSTFTVDPTEALDWLSRQMNGEQSFGARGKPDIFQVRQLESKDSMTSAVKSARAIIARPDGGNIIKATTAMAALGDQAAQRGLGTLRIAAQIDARKSPFGWNPIEQIFGSTKKEIQKKLDAAAVAKGIQPVQLPPLSITDVNWKKTADGLTKGLQAAGVVLTFVIPPAGIALTGAMAAADAVLSDPNVAKVQGVINDTKALAQLGDESARKGYEVLENVNRVRTELGVGPGELAIKYDGPVNLAEFTAELTLAQLDALKVAAGMESEAQKAERLAAETKAAADKARHDERQAQIAVDDAKRKAEYEKVRQAALPVSQASVDRLFAQADAGLQLRTAVPIDDTHYMVRQAKALKAAREVAEQREKLAADAARKQRAAADAAKRAAASIPVVKPGWFARLIDWLF